MCNQHDQNCETCKPDPFDRFLCEEFIINHTFSKEAMNRILGAMYIAAVISYGLCFIVLVLVFFLYLHLGLI